MKLTLKITLLLVAITSTLVMVHWYSSTSREHAIFDLVTVDDHRLLGHALRRLATGVENKVPPAQLEALINQLPAGRETRMRWVWLTPASALGLGGPLTPDEWQELVAGRTISRLDSCTHAGLTLCVVPLETSGDRISALEVQMSLMKRDVFMSHEFRELVLLVTTLLVVTPLLIFAIGHALLGRPLRELMGLVQRVAAGDLSGGVHLTQDDELGRLGDTLTEMVSKLRCSREALVKEEEATRSAHLQLWHLDRLALLGQMAAGVAHEVGTPLNVIQGHARLIQGGTLDADGVKGSAATIAEQTARITQILNAMLGLARRRPSARTATDLEQLATSTIRLFAAAHRVTPQLVIQGDGSKKALVNVDPAQLSQVLMNLLVNANQASGGNGPITVGLVPDKRDHEKCGAGEEPLTALYVEDEGPGVPDELRRQIFEPFFTTKGEDQGTGLGLSIAREIITEHGGCLRLEEGRARGARFWIVLPRIEA